MLYLPLRVHLSFRFLQSHCVRGPLEKPTLTLCPQLGTYFLANRDSLDIISIELIANNAALLSQKM